MPMGFGNSEEQCGPDTYGDTIGILGARRRFSGTSALHQLIPTLGGVRDRNFGLCHQLLTSHPGT